MVKLRLKRVGRKKRPSYRIVAMDITSPRDGQALGQLGTYDPLHSRFTLDEEALVRWLKDGAQMTDTVHDLLKSQGVLARMRGFEGKAREDALLKDKPKRRKKLGVATAAADAAEGTKEAAPAEVAADEAAASAAASESTSREEVEAADSSGAAESAATAGESGAETDSDQASDEG